VVDSLPVKGCPWMHHEQSLPEFRLGFIMHVTPRQSLLLACFFALGFAGIFVAEFFAWVGMAACFFIIVGQIIILFVARGRDRARSIGFLVPAVLYGTLVLFVSENELKYSDGVLPQSRLLQSRISTEYPQPRTAAGEPSASWQWKSRMRQMERRSQSLMPLGHALIAVILGFGGSAFGDYTYRRSGAISV
jgi:hypothetical protein